MPLSFNQKFTVQKNFAISVHKLCKRVQISCSYSVTVSFNDTGAGICWQMSKSTGRASAKDAIVKVFIHSRERNFSLSAFRIVSRISEISRVQISYFWSQILYGVV